jgi:protein-disulfide isomerase
VSVPLYHSPPSTHLRVWVFIKSLRRKKLAKDSLGGPLIIASLMLSVSIVGAGYLLSRSINRGSEKLQAMAVALDGLPSVAPGAAAAAAAPSRPSRPGRPDPNKRYDIVTAGSPSKGPESAKVTIVEWSDFQCPYCAKVTPTLVKIQQEYGDDVQIVFKHLPLSMHTKAPAAHAASEAAHQQGKFWEMHDMIFASQREMSEAKYVEYATELGLDIDLYNADVKSSKVKSRIDGDVAAASKLGVTGTPSLFINGRFLSGAQPFTSFKRIIDEELKKDS